MRSILHQEALAWMVDRDIHLDFFIRNIITTAWLCSIVPSAATVSLLTEKTKLQLLCLPRVLPATTRTVICIKQNPPPFPPFAYIHRLLPLLARIDYLFK